MSGELVARARAAFGWDGDITVTAGARGARGQIWRIDVGSASYALKEIFEDPPSPELMAAELEFSRRAVGAGVRLPMSHADRDGQYVVASGRGGWLRLYDWVDLRPIDPAAPTTPRALGSLLARLHRCAAPMSGEADGGAPDPWYEDAPSVDEWARVAAADAPWSDRLADRVTTLPELCAEVSPAASGELLMCHRDLHPENVLGDPAGALVVVDWDGLGPATASRELAAMLFDWFCDGPVVDLDAVRELYDAYISDGGPGRITALADFSMLLAGRLNFLLRQLQLALDPEAERRHRDWAEREIDEALRILPTSRQLAAVLSATRG